MVTASDRQTALWTGQWMATADGSAAPVIVHVPTDRHVNNGRGLAHYLAKGFKPVEQIPAAGADESLRLGQGHLPDVAAYLAAMDDPAPPAAARKEKPCSPARE